MENGTAIVIMRPHTVPPEQYESSVVAERAAVLGLRLPAIALLAGEQVLLLRGTIGERYVADAYFVSSREQVGIFKVAGAWRFVDPRSTPRFSLSTLVEVRSVLGNSKQEGHLVDVGLGGMAVSVATRPGGSEVEVAVQYGGYAGRLRCVIARIEELEDETTLLRLRFSDLTQAQEAFVRQLVARAAEHESLLRLAS